MSDAGLEVLIVPAASADGQPFVQLEPVLKDGQRT